MKLHAYSQAAAAPVQGLSTELAGLNVSDTESRLKALFKVLVRSKSTDEASGGLAHYLTLGCAMFGMEHGLLLRQLSTQVAEVIAVGERNDAFYVGQHLTIERTFAAQIFADDAVQLSPKVLPSPTSVPACTYHGHIVNSYIGAPVHTAKASLWQLYFLPLRI